MPSISVPAAVLGAGAIGGAASLGSGIIGANASESAAKEQEQAASQAVQLQQNEFNTTQANLKPFISAGQTGISQLLSALPNLTQVFNPTQAQLAQTPGYQFTLNQGLNATKNAYTAQGLGGTQNANGQAVPSGALGKGIAQYAEGLASTTYQQQFQNYLTQNQQIYNMLGGVAQTGENAAAMTGQQGLTAAANEGSLLTSGAAAGAAGQIGAASSIGNSLTGISNTGSNTALMLALNNSGLFGGSSGPSGDLNAYYNTPGLV